MIVFVLLFTVLGMSNASKAQFVVTDPGQIIQTIIDRVTNAYSQYKNYQEYKTATDAIRALKKISSAVKNTKKVADCYTLIAKHKELYNNMWAAASSDRKFSNNEKVGIKNNLSGFVNMALNNIDDLKTAIVEGNATMNDKERIDMIDRVYTRLSTSYNNMYAYSSSIHSVATSRAAERYEREHKSDGFYGSNQHN